MESEVVSLWGRGGSSLVSWHGYQRLLRHPRHLYVLFEQDKKWTITVMDTVQEARDTWNSRQAPRPRLVLFPGSLSEAPGQENNFCSVLARSPRNPVQKPAALVTTSQQTWGKISTSFSPLIKIWNCALEKPPVWESPWPGKCRQSVSVFSDPPPVSLGVCWLLPRWGWLTPPCSLENSEEKLSCILLRNISFLLMINGQYGAALP